MVDQNLKISIPLIEMDFQTMTEPPLKKSQQEPDTRPEGPNASLRKCQVFAGFFPIFKCRDFQISQPVDSF